MLSEDTLRAAAVKTFNERVMSNLAGMQIDPLAHMLSIDATTAKNWIQDVLGAEARFDAFIVETKAKLGWYPETKDVLILALHVCEHATTMAAAMADMVTIGNLGRYAVEGSSSASEDRDPRDGLSNQLYHMLTGTDEIDDSLHIYGAMHLRKQEACEVRFTNRTGEWSMVRMSPSLMAEIYPLYDPRADAYPVMTLTGLRNTLAVMIRQQC
jgi:hypothetical protein